MVKLVKQAVVGAGREGVVGVKQASLCLTEHMTSSETTAIRE